MEKEENAKSEVRQLGDRLDILETERKNLEEQEQQLLLSLPNLIDERVPEGNSEQDNMILESWGDIPTFDFTPKEHHILAEELGLYDAERATKLAGTRFSVLKGDVARLERALVNFFPE